MKPQPGEILDILDTGLPRPRSLEALEEQTTVDLVIRIRHMLFTDRDRGEGQDSLATPEGS